MLLSVGRGLGVGVSFLGEEGLALGPVGSFREPEPEAEADIVCYSKACLLAENKVFRRQYNNGRVLRGVVVVGKREGERVSGARAF